MRKNLSSGGTYYGLTNPMGRSSGYSHRDTESKWLHTMRVIGLPISKLSKKVSMSQILFEKGKRKVGLGM